MALLEASLNVAAQYLGNVWSLTRSLTGLLQGMLIVLPSISSNTSHS